MDADPLAIRSISRAEEAVGAGEAIYVTERDPLLGGSVSSTRPERVKKAWYRPRPLWLVPFAITASLCRSMTLAPRTEVFIKLACEGLRDSRHHHTNSRHPHTIYLSSVHANISVPHTRLPGFSDIDGPVPFTLDRATVVRIPQGRVSPPRFRPSDLPTVGSPPIHCLTDTAVQAGAAKLQTIMTTTMGILSALTTGWWGQFGDRHGRTKVIATAVSGLLFTDVMFIIASNPPAVFRGHAHTLLIVAPVVEGLLGGWSTLQGATHAYISDCTSHGSRAHIFSRFTGVFYIGFAVGPEIAAVILRATHMTTLVFYASAICAGINLFLLLFVFPESLSTELRSRNVEAAQDAKKKYLQDANGKIGLWKFTKSSVKAFFEPLAILGPKPRVHQRGNDWTLSLSAMALFGFFLSAGLFQIKYLYAEHMFSWDAERLSYYITAVGSARALHLLFLLPGVIRLCKPAPPVSSKGKGKKTKGKAVPTPSALVSDIKFDLLVAKCSIMLDILSHGLTTLAPDTSQGLFVSFTVITSFGAGIVPALQSVAMSVLHLRAEGGEEGGAGGKGGAEVGKLFGAFAVLQAVGSMILGPMLYGTVYSLTVALYPKTVFVLAAGLLLASLSLLLLVRPPRVDVPIQIRVDTQVHVDVERARGRSRRSKDISSGLR